jgi:hypothetical protein
MLWFTIWFMVILKIPILYLAYVIWWAVKDPPDAYAGPATDNFADSGGPGWRPSRDRDPVRRPRRGPHGAPERRPARVLPGRARARV